jgi:hypothetical protein
MYENALKEATRQLQGSNSLNNCVRNAEDTKDNCGVIALQDCFNQKSQNLYQQRA